MIPLLTEHLWVWIVAGGFVFAIGAILFSQSGNIKAFIVFSGCALLILGLGVFLVRFVKTDRKEIKKTIYELADAVERNDLPGVLDRIDGAAGKTIAKATHHLGLARIESAKVSLFSIKNVNRYTSPPTATVVFNGAVRGNVSVSSIASDFVIVVHFESVELAKSSDGRWRVTDHCRFKYPGYDGN